MSSKPLELEGLGVEPESQTPVILLREPDSDTQIPIWIGEQEATAILVAIEGADVPRPLAHDLMRSLLETLGAEVSRVEVTRIQDSTFYAEITLAGADAPAPSPPDAPIDAASPDELMKAKPAAPAPGSSDEVPHGQS